MPKLFFNEGIKEEGPESLLDTLLRAVKHSVLNVHHAAIASPTSHLHDAVLAKNV